ncbi:MAG: acetyl-CoA decarbonylase/synthase complex subunit delta [Chloroflexi bacterium]|nr:acetyl-CoA decarbonylase/synthase complex subunit delta [Chloroflexota bacterium]
MPPVETPVEKWAGKIHEVNLGGDARRLVVGGETTLPFLHFEGAIPHPPAVAVEVQDRPPASWAPELRASWGEAMEDPASWAKKAVEYGADLIVLYLSSAHPDDQNTGPQEAKKTVTRVLSTVDAPLIILGPGIAEKDNEVLVAAAEAAAGRRVALGFCEQKNYRTIIAACMANNHVAVAKTPVEINLAKQLNILICDMGLAPDSILMDPTTGALGYGLEYTYSVMERLRLAGLQGDKMAAMPMFCTVGEEAWRQKEARATEGIPAAWGDIATRALRWEELTAMTLLLAGADVVVLRHPQVVQRIKATIQKLMTKE